MFFRDDEYPAAEGVRLEGFPRYREVLERDWKHLFLVGLITLAGLVPAGLGIAYAVMSSSVLVLIAACAAGGLIAGPAVSGMVDCVFRGLRDCLDDWWISYKRQFKQNWKSSLLPGIVFTMFIGFAVFMGMMMFAWSQTMPTLGTIAVYLFSIVLAIMFFSVYWPQLVLFKQSTRIRLKNCLLFFIMYFWRTLGVSALQTFWWIAAALFMPWTAFLVPFLSVWFIMYVSFFLLYPKLNEAFEIEKQIAEQFPGQMDELEYMETESDNEENK